MGELIKKPITLVDVYLEPTVSTTTPNLSVGDTGYITGTKRATKNRGANFIYQLSGWFAPENTLVLAIIGTYNVDITPIGILTYDCDVQYCNTINQINAHNYLGNQGVKITTVGNIVDIEIDNPNVGGFGSSLVVFYSLIIYST